MPYSLKNFLFAASIFLILHSLSGYNAQRWPYTTDSITNARIADFYG
jgi:hypothetical protein